MPEFPVEISITCVECGGTTITLPADKNDDSIAKCQSCGIDVGKWGDIKREARRTAFSGFKETARAAFKKIGRR